MEVSIKVSSRRANVMGAGDLRTDFLSDIATRA